MKPSLSALALPGAVAVAAVAVLVDVLRQPDPETWRVVGAAVGAVLLVGLFAVGVYGEARARRRPRAGPRDA